MQKEAYFFQVEARVCPVLTSYSHIQIILAYLREDSVLIPLPNMPPWKTCVFQIYLLLCEKQSNICIPVRTTGDGCETEVFARGLHPFLCSYLKVFVSHLHTAGEKFPAILIQ